MGRPQTRGKNSRIMILNKTQNFIITCALLFFLQVQRIAFGQSELKLRYEELSRQIEHYSQLYYAGEPTITDTEYNAMIKELIKMEQQHPQWIRPSSPTQHVGSAILDEATALAHKSPMLSMDNIREIQGLIDFDQRVKQKLNETSHRGISTASYYVEEKIDGIAISLQYENGKLTRGLTRGDGKRGQDVTAIIKNIASIPKHLRTDAPEGRLLTGRLYPEFLEVRGEIIIPKTAFKRINATRQRAGEKLFANARNLAAGSLQLIDPAKAEQRGLEMVAFGIGKVSAPIAMTQDELLKRLREFGFNVPLKSFFCQSIKEAIDAIQELKSQREQIPYEIDGVVVKVNNLMDQHALGATSKSVRGMIAFKFTETQARTTIQKIIWQVGRTGKITPVALLKPVWLDGNKISRASLHNAEVLQRLDARAGDTVLIEKAGRVIPKIVNVLHRDVARPRLDNISHCPVCSSKIKEGSRYRCENKTCPARIKKQIEYFAEKDKMNIPGLGQALINWLVDEGHVKNSVDLYRLDINTLKKCNSVNREKARALLQSIENSKKQPFARFLAALGIPLIGPHKAGILAGHFQNIDALQSASMKDLEKISGIGETSARAISEFFKDAWNHQMLRNFKREGVTKNRRDDSM